MVRNNNIIPNGHFHKKYQRHIKTWFNQPMKKMKRQRVRTRRSTKLAPRPIKLLRAMVHCPSVRYNRKIRAGRGFTFQELKQVGINRHFARTIGIAVDHRRRNRCVESQLKNVQRLKEYKAKLILLPIEETVKFDKGENLNKIPKTHEQVKARKVNKEEKSFGACVTLRKARADAKYADLRIKRKLSKTNTFDH